MRFDLSLLGALSLINTPGVTILFSLNEQY